MQSAPASDAALADVPGLRLPLRPAEPGATFPSGPAYRSFTDRFADAYRAELAAFVEVTKGGPVLGATVADAVEVAWLAEAATESLRRGVPVTIAEVRNS